MFYRAQENAQQALSASGPQALNKKVFQGVKQKGVSGCGTKKGVAGCGTKKLFQAVEQRHSRAHPVDIPWR